MDITTLAAMRDKRAGVLIHLKQENFRNIGTEWNLYATFEVLDTIGKKAVPITLLVMSNRRSHGIKAQLQAAGLAYVETALQPAGKSVPSRPDPTAQQAAISCSKTCLLCGKTNFDDATGCHNASVFSPCIGDWICNLDASL